MTHTTEKGDVRTVRDEMEKKRRERSRSGAEGHTKKSVFSTAVTITRWGPRSDAVTMCIVPFTTY